MPTYSYKCIKCSKIEDIIHGMREEYKDLCECGGKMQKIIYPSTISFSGSGFYSTDSKGK